MHSRFLADPIIRLSKSMDSAFWPRKGKRDTTPSASQAVYRTNQEASDMTQDTEVSDKSYGVTRL